MNVVDSSGWLEYFTDGSNADFFAPVIENTQDVLVPTISLFEVFKRVLVEKNRDDVTSQMVLSDNKVPQTGRYTLLRDSSGNPTEKSGWQTNSPYRND